MYAKSFQSCPTLCDPVDQSPPGSSVQATLPARILEWVAVPSCRDLPNPEIKPTSPMTPALADGFFTNGTAWEAPALCKYIPAQLVFSYYYFLPIFGGSPWASLVAQMVKNLPAMQETQVQSLGQEDTLEKGTAFWWVIGHGSQ